MVHIRQLAATPGTELLRALSVLSWSQLPATAPGHAVRSVIDNVACGMFGVSPAVALAASLLGRGRDFAIAVPSLACWQVLEGRRAWQDAAVLDLAGTGRAPGQVEG